MCSLQGKPVIPSLPTGTVTFLFTDIEGSTKLAREQSDTWETLRARHHTILREAIESNNGFVFQVIGDAFCAAFDTVGDALRAAVKSQTDLHTEHWGDALIKVRMGIHTGRAEIQDSGAYRGYLTMSCVQRVMSVAYGGQILLSNSSAELVRADLGEELFLLDMKEHQLKGLVHPEHLWQVGAPGLQQDFPPLRSLKAIPNNLPLQLTSFIGREKELADVQRLMADTHLLTLIGPGGTGKSRLSLQAATDLLHTFRHGAWLVELAPLSDPSAVPAAVLAALDLPAEVHRPAIDMLCDYLHEKETLIILDNCEHLVDACARMVDRLLHAAPGLRILASSREALGIAGEVSYRVPSLGLPDLNHLPALESLSQYEAVRLFIERAQAALPEFNVTNENAPAVAQICHRLDGIPLAIELAAAKVRVLSTEQISKRLDDRFRLLTGGSRTALERHQTLRATLDWSYNFLPAPEQMLFRRLSTFVNGWALEAAESVCKGETVIREDVFGLLEQLANKSLVSTDTWKSETRYRMLETMRQYAGEKLIETGESELLRDRHLDHYLDLAETAAPHLVRPEQVEWLDRLEGDHDNLRAALEWSLGKQRPEQVLRLSAALGTFWYLHCHWIEGSRWLERALAMPFDDPTPAEKAARTRALYQDAGLALDLGNYERAHASAAASFALCQEGTDSRDLAISRFYLGLAFDRADDYQNARSLYEQSLAEFRALKDPYWEAYCQWTISMGAVWRGEQSYREVVTSNLEVARKTGERQLIALVLSYTAYYMYYDDRLVEATAYVEESDRVGQEVGFNLSISDLRGLIAHASRDYHRARKLYGEAIEAFELIGDRWLKSSVVAYLGILARDEGNLSEAQTHVEQALAIAREIGNKGAIAVRLALLGQIHYLRGNLEEAKSNFKESLFLGKLIDSKFSQGRSLILAATYLAGPSPRLVVQILSAIHAQQVKQRLGWALSPVLRGDFEGALARARLALGESAFEAAWAEGETLSIEEACDLALKALEEM
jgi:predicted ATPase/class 3 adenylate cyclase